MLMMTAPNHEGREPMDQEDFDLLMAPQKRQVKRIPEDIQTVDQLLARYAPRLPCDG